MYIYIYSFIYIYVFIHEAILRTIACTPRARTSSNGAQNGLTCCLLGLQVEYAERVNPRTATGQPKPICIELAPIGSLSSRGCP